MKNLFVLLVLLTNFSFTMLNAQDVVAVNNKIEISENAELLSWDHMTFEFGDINQNVPAEATFTVTNNSDQPLLLKEVKPTCGCTIAAYNQDPILPGESTLITTTYNAKKEGTFHKSIKVLTNLSDEKISLRLKGNVVKEKS